MEFENQYLSYVEYKELGGNIPLMPFNLLEYKAEKKIDEVTFNRFRKVSNNQYPKELKLCVYELLDFFDKDANSIFVSESIGDYTATRKDKKEIEKEKEKIINQYLAGVKIDDIFVLYCGADVHEN